MLKQFDNEEKSPPDPNRKPVISGNGSSFFSAYDPAADVDANLVGTIEWSLSDGSITLAVYPKEAKINGQPVTDKTRIRGHNILNPLVNALENLFQKRVAEYVRELGEANRKEIEDTFQIKGLNGIWAGDSDNLTTFNRLYKVGLSKELAARQTFTGKQAFRVFGFSEVKFNKFEPDLDHPSNQERRRLGFTAVNCTFYPKGI